MKFGNTKMHVTQYAPADQLLIALLKIKKIKNLIIMLVLFICNSDTGSYKP